MIFKPENIDYYDNSEILPKSSFDFNKNVLLINRCVENYKKHIASQFSVNFFENVKFEGFNDDALRAISNFYILNNNVSDHVFLLLSCQSKTELICRINEINTDINDVVPFVDDFILDFGYIERNGLTKAWKFNDYIFYRAIRNDNPIFFVGIDPNLPERSLYVEQIGVGLLYFCTNEAYNFIKSHGQNI